MICSYCGTENANNAAFCTNCGRALKSDSQSANLSENRRQYDMDDLYNAAVNGNVTEVAVILKCQPELLKEEFETQTDDGIVIKATALFSIISYYSDTSIHTAVMDEITKAGADYNQLVKVYYGDRHSFRSLLYYPVAIWQNLELAKYLLEHGANPNAVVEENVNTISYLQSYAPLLYYAITECDGTDMMEMMLSYGADPKICYQPYVDDFHVYQKLPMMVYTVIDEISIEKTACLIRYGASPQDTVDLGKGYKKINSVYGYVKMAEPNKTAVIDAALIQAKKQPAPYVKNVYSAMYSAGQQTQQVSTSTGVPQKVNVRIDDKINKKCYNKFVAYLFANFALLGIGFGIIAPILYASKSAKASGGFLMFGIPCLLIAALIGFLVYKAGKKRGQKYFFGEFIKDSIVIFAKVMMFLSIILIPLAVSIGRGSGDWSDRKTTDGTNVTVQDVGNGEYRDALGNKYNEVDN